MISRPLSTYVLGPSLAGLLMGAASATPLPPDPAPDPAPVGAADSQQTPLLREPVPSIASSLSSESEPLPPALPVTSGTWTAQGPGPALNGQVENVDPDNEVVGAIHVVTAHPTDPDILYAGAVNGGVWKTTNASATRPNWTALTDDRSSLSIGALEFDPTDATNNTLIAGIGRYSSFGSQGGARTGLLRTTDGGATWTELDGGGVMLGKNISGVSARDNVILASVNIADSFTFDNIGIFRSTDTGGSFTRVGQGDGSTTGLPGGLCHDLGSNASFDASTYYTSVIYADLVGGSNGIYKSDDTGATWNKVSDAAIDALLADNQVSNVEITVGADGAVYVGILKSGQLRNGGVFVSNDGGATWSQMDELLVNETGGDVGTNPRFKPEANAPGSQGSIHFSILADPVVDGVLYVGGDRQPAGFNDQYGFPNALGADNFTGRLFRGDASVSPTGSVPSPQWEHLTHTQGAAGMSDGGTASNSAPHADSREMAFDAAGDLIEVDDGGIYRRTLPRDNTGDWFSINGDIQVTEQHDIAYDTVSDIIISGNQDTGTTYQTSTGSAVWNSVSTADGGDVAVTVDPNNPNQSVRYSSFQFLGAFAKRTYNASGTLLGTSYPSLSVISGNALSEQFVTPVEVNTVDAIRLLIGAGNGLYESLDQGSTVSQLTSSGINSAGNTMVYGGRSGGVDNPDLIYAATGADIQVRTTSDGSVVSVGGWTGGTVRGVIADREDWMSVFAIDDAQQVFHSTDAGATWTEITGDLPAATFGFDLRSIDLVQQAAAKAVVVGTTQGIYGAPAPTFDTWSRLGSGLPNAPVWDLDYDVEDDVLVAGTLGRGAWLLPDAAAEFVDTAELSVSKDDSADPVVLGEAFSYSISIGNALTADAAENVVMTDSLPAEVSFVGVDPSGTCSESAGTVTCNIGTLAPGASFVATIEVTAASIGSADNTAEVATTTANDGADQASESTTIDPLLGDLDNDGCVGRNDVRLLMLLIRARNTDPQLHDINADGVVNVADVRSQVLIYTNPTGLCP